MINYPIKRKQMEKESISTSNRGMDLEKAINETNDSYIRDDIAYIYKKPIPIQIVKVDYEKRSSAKISEAYYKVPSTTDYNGIYKGKYIDFEAKETNSTTSFPLKNIHEHQVLHLHNVIRHGGIGFLIVSFSRLGVTYLLEESILHEYYEMKDVSRKSIPLEVFKEKGHLIKEGYVRRLDYLKIVDQLYFQSK